MTPIEFPQQNGSLGPPEGMTEEECMRLPVFRNGIYCISCWQLTDEEIIRLIQNDGKIFLSIMSGPTQAPCFLSTEFPFQ